jgi:hypothetical protein
MDDDETELEELAKIEANRHLLQKDKKKAQRFYH